MVVLDNGLSISLHFMAINVLISGNLRAHIVRLHTIVDDDKFRCAYCTCSFKKLGSLNAHTSRYHPEIGSQYEDTPHLDPDDPVSDDLLSKAIQSTITPPADDTDPVAVTSDQVTVMGDRMEDGSVRKHLVRSRVADGVRFYICTFCPR